MKTLLILIAVALVGCATNQTLTPEQLAQYQQVVHQAVQAGLQDYKTVKPLIH